VVGRHVFGFSDEAIAVIGDIVLYVSAASLSDLEFRRVGIGRSEIWDSQ